MTRVCWGLQRARIAFYRMSWTCKRVEGKPLLHSATQLMGLGQISFGNSISLGVFQSPGFLDSSIYIEARSKEALIQIGSGVYINNRVSIISEVGVSIGKDTLIGYDVQIVDSDFHGLGPNERMDTSKAKKAPVIIGANVFIGAGAIILKGVSIGDNSVIGAGSIVTKSIPANSIACGNPASVVRSIL